MTVKLPLVALLTLLLTLAACTEVEPAAPLSVSEPSVSEPVTSAPPLPVSVPQVPAPPWVDPVPGTPVSPVTPDPAPPSPPTPSPPTPPPPVPAPLPPTPTKPVDPGQITTPGGLVIPTTPLSRTPLGPQALKVLSRASQLQLLDVLGAVANRAGLGRVGAPPMVRSEGVIGTLGLRRASTSCEPPLGPIVDADGDGHYTYTQVIDCASIYNGKSLTYQGTYRSRDQNDRDPRSGYSYEGSGVYRVDTPLPTGTELALARGVFDAVFTGSAAYDVTVIGSSELSTYVYDQSSRGFVVRNSLARRFDSRSRGAATVTLTPDADGTGSTYTVDGSASFSGLPVDLDFPVTGSYRLSGSIHYSKICRDPVTDELFSGPDRGNILYTSNGVTETLAVTSCIRLEQS